MSTVYPALQKLIEDGVVRTSEDLSKVDRRQRIAWNLRREVPGSGHTYDEVTETLERMNRRAAAGQPMSKDAMKGASRPQKKAPPAKKARPAKVPKPPKAPKSPKVAKVPKAPKAPSVAASASPPPKPAAASTAPAPESTLPIATNVYMIFDDSRSMSERKLVADTNEQARRMRDRLAAGLPDANVEICVFTDTLKWLPACKAKDVPEFKLVGQGGTALFAAFNAGLRKAIASKVPSLVYITTDGEDVHSNLYGVCAEHCVEAVKEALATGMITIACVGPPMSASFFRRCGVPDACVRDFKATAEDVVATTEQATAGVDSFVATRKAGKTKLDRFFVDADKVGLAEVARACVDVTAAMLVHEVKKVAPIKEYVEKDMGKPFLFGQCYYQLVAKGTLIKGRAIVAQHRDDPQKRLFKGPALRGLLGLPSDRDVEIEPRSLGMWRLFVESASPNRNLVAKTTLLYDKSHTGGTKATWTDDAKGSTPKKAAS